MQLTKSGIISADNSGTFNKVGWQSCARTDKGVSALGTKPQVPFDLMSQET